MNNTKIEIIGYIGCFLLFCSFFPQTYQIIKNKKYESISLSFIFLILLTSLTLSCYSYLKNIYPILIANISVFLNNFITLLMIIRYKIIKKEDDKNNIELNII